MARLGAGLEGGRLVVLRRGEAQGAWIARATDQIVVTVGQIEQLLQDDRSLEGTAIPYQRVRRALGLLREEAGEPAGVDARAQRPLEPRLRVRGFGGVDQDALEDLGGLLGAVEVVEQQCCAAQVEGDRLGGAGIVGEGLAERLADELGFSGRWVSPDTRFLLVEAARSLGDASR